jgi:hypothetical protein
MSMQTSEHAQAKPTKTLVGLWPATISQDSVDHLVRVLERRTNAQAVAVRQVGYVYVYTFGDLTKALEQFEVLSKNFLIR